MAAQLCGAAGLDRWVGRWRCSSSPVHRPPAPAVSPPSRRTRTNWKVGCASVPRELTAAAAAEPTAPPEAEEETEEEGVECDGCAGAGWLLCDFCKGKKNNVKSESSRVYRRCPTCKAGISFAQDAGSTNASLIQRATTHEQRCN
ncbi:hypothetical protein E2562_001770 [Oryza meyeriana var. granulata]|uniref:Uncharacterized protein n=1 Tax=Oryza meyeriana var. granulata TaxID=110450 RepID=A0A6G1CEC7_9ORYZ|nr:hypothetical protein E2562_001770 [Oryza meyeriana var. granulata]